MQIFILLYLVVLPSNAIKLSIKSPCSESWDAMTGTGGVRHCAHCQKSVTDFTTWTDEELFSYFSVAKQRVCGRLRAEQLDKLYGCAGITSRPLKLPVTLSAAVLTLGLLLVPASAKARFLSAPYASCRLLPEETDGNKFIVWLYDDSGMPVGGTSIVVYFEDKTVQRRVTDSSGLAVFEITEGVVFRMKIEHPDADPNPELLIMGKENAAIKRIIIRRPDICKEGPGAVFTGDIQQILPLPKTVKRL